MSKKAAFHSRARGEIVCDDLAAILARVAGCICTAGLAASTVGVAFSSSPIPADLEKPGWCELAGAEGVFVCLSDEPASSLGAFWKSRADIPPPFLPREAGQVPEERAGTIMLRFPDVMARVGLSRTTIWRKIRANEFPAPISLGENSVGWPSAWIEDWLTSRPRVSYAPAAEAA